MADTEQNANVPKMLFHILDTHYGVERIQNKNVRSTERVLFSF